MNLSGPNWRGKELASEAKVSFDSQPAGRSQFQRSKCRVVQLVAHQILDLGVLGSSPSAAAFLPLRRTATIVVIPRLLACIKGSCDSFSDSSVATPEDT